MFQTQKKVNLQQIFILNFLTAPSRSHPVLSHHHLYVDFAIALLLSLNLLYQKQSQISSLLCSNPPMASLLTYNTSRSPKHQDVESLCRSLLPLQIYLPQCSPSSSLLETYWPPCCFWNTPSKALTSRTLHCFYSVYLAL